jgi:AraC family transcriptional regulator
VKSTTRSFYELAVRAALTQILASLDEALDLALLARSACLSPLHFHHIFRGMLGETPLELHRRLRLERAAQQLANSERPVTSIAFEAGYETHESFTRAFRQAYGSSPSELRARFRKTDESCHAAHATRLAARSGIHFGEGPLFVTSNRGEIVMKVSIETMSALRLASVRHLGPYNTIGDSFAQLGQLAGPAGLVTGNALMVAIYHDDPEATAPSELRSDAGISVTEEQTIPASLHEVRVPGGRYAMTTHIGSFAGLGDTWARLMGEWLPQSGHRLADGVSYEIYRSDMRTTPESELRTDIFVPIEESST